MYIKTIDFLYRNQEGVSGAIIAPRAIPLNEGLLIRSDNFI